MRLVFARARLEAWLRPTLVVPFVVAPEVSAEPCPLILGELRGFVRDGVTVIVTPRGTELPIPAASDWLVMDVVRLVAQIDRMPELEPGSRRA